jgi:hypothetical protein
MNNYSFLVQSSADRTDHAKRNPRRHLAQSADPFIVLQSEKSEISGQKTAGNY